MTVLEVSLLIIGVIVFVISFIFASKMDRYDEERKIELTEKHKAEIEKQVKTVLYDQVEYIKEKTEIELDKLSNIKMNEMNEYSETILSEINRNHNEVMFLYDMLNEKKKEVNNSIRDISSVKKELGDLVNTASEILAQESQTNKKTTGKTNKASSKNKKEQLDGQMEFISIVKDETVEDLSDKHKKNANKKSGIEKAESPMVVQKVKKTDSTVASDNNNNNDKILKLYSQGKSVVEIAKELGLGIGEVKLVIELFRGGK